MIGAVATDLLFLGSAGLLAIALYFTLRSRIIIVPGALTRLFGYVMSAHAFLNLVTRNASSGTHDLLAVVVANVAALVFLATYLNVLRRHQEGPILAALSLALASACAVFAFMASGQLAMSREIALSAVVTGVLSGLVLWRSGRMRPTGHRSVEMSR